MKSYLTFSSLIAVVLLLLFQSWEQKGYSNLAGAPAARAGSPFDGSGITCNASTCHTSFPLGTRTGWITSNIPGTGYLSGQTYTITVTATSPNCSRFGFEISPQTATGALAGTIVITNAVQTRLAPTNNTKYITHTSSGIAASPIGTKTWTFDWIAPITLGTGTVTFYGAFNRTNSNNSVSGDSIFKCTLVVSENAANGWSESENKLFLFDAYPNPSFGHLSLSIIAKQNMNYSAEIIDITGKSVKEFFASKIYSGVEKVSELDVSDIKSGVYFLIVKSKERIATKKIIIL